MFDIVFSLMVLITVAVIAGVIVATVPIVRRERRLSAAQSARWAESLRRRAETSAAADEQEAA